MGTVLTTLLFNAGTALNKYMCRAGRILKWPSHWIYYVLNPYISYLHVHFAYINTRYSRAMPKLLRYLTLAVVSPEFKTARGRKRRTVLLLSFFFLPSRQKLNSAITPLYDKLRGRFSNENTALTTV